MSAAWDNVDNRNRHKQFLSEVHSITEFIQKQVSASSEDIEDRIEYK